jgi:hypothetical protein
MHISITAIKTAAKTKEQTKAMLIKLSSTLLDTQAITTQYQPS